MHLGTLLTAFGIATLASTLALPKPDPNVKVGIEVKDEGNAAVKGTVFSIENLLLQKATCDPPGLNIPMIACDLQQRLPSGVFAGSRLTSKNFYVIVPECLEVWEFEGPGLIPQMASRASRLLARDPR
ncbi:hypothetical protein BDZ45DRAFT_796588 [Acephala macrosclerotiorum]|nr:hypothetical protein BDZ45DRAFT_796588 [Acephala macrosclerotiorum]